MYVYKLIYICDCVRELVVDYAINT